MGVIDDSIDMSHPFYSSNIDASSAYNTGILYNDDVYRELMPTMPVQSATDTSAVWDKANIKREQFPATSMSSNDYHGTCVTGCIAAYDSETNAYGPAYSATIVPIRVDFPCQTFDIHVPDRSMVGEEAFAQAIGYNNSAIDFKNNSYGSAMGYNVLESELKLSAIADARANNTILLYSSGNWTIKVYDYDAEDTFTVSDVYSTFYMGALRNSAVPEPSTWALMALGVVFLVFHSFLPHNRRIFS